MTLRIDSDEEDVLQYLAEHPSSTVRHMESNLFCMNIAPKTLVGLMERRGLIFCTGRDEEGTGESWWCITEAGEEALKQKRSEDEMSRCQYCGGSSH